MVHDIDGHAGLLSAANYNYSSIHPFLIARSFLLFIQTLTAEVSLLITNPEDARYRIGPEKSATNLAWSFSRQAAPIWESRCSSEQRE